MRRISFSLTQEQVRNQSKRVTRRNGWKFLKPGDRVQPVVKCMGLKKGEKHQLIGVPIIIEEVSRERLCDINSLDVFLEGFTNWGSDEFIKMYCKANNCPPDQIVTRIQFRYEKCEGCNTYEACKMFRCLRIRIEEE